MKKYKFLSILIVLVLAAMVVAPVQAQLGGTQKSSFSVQNIGDTQATVQVMFVDSNGVTHTPNPLIPASGSTPALPNPFPLDPGASKEIYVPAVTGINPGSYSVVISSSQPIVATANLLGEGTVNYNGTYSGLDAGAKTFYLPSFAFNYYGWYSHVTVQNTEAGVTNVTVNIACAGGKTGTLSKTGLAGYSSITFDTKATPPTGFDAGTKCNGAAVVSSTATAVVAIDNQTVPDKGLTQSYNGVLGGATKLYIPSLFVHYYNWDSSINIQKIAAGNTTVTVKYSDGKPDSTCNLTDAVPACLLYMPSAHGLGAGQTRALFGATVTSSNGNVVGVVNSATSAALSQAQTYDAVADGSSTGTALAPGLFNSYYGWTSALDCQNVSTTPTKLHMVFQGHEAQAFDTISLNQGQVFEFYMANYTNIVGTKFNGGATVTAVTSGAKITCVINHNNATQMTSTAGDWSTSTNAFKK